MRLCYISHGTIPSQWAHSIQTVKMAEAFAARVPDFELLTRVHWFDLLKPRFDFESWYGIQRPFRITRIPFWRTFTERQVFDDRYDDAAVRYCLQKRASLVYTRSPNAGRLSVGAGLKTIVETHQSAMHQTVDHLSRISDQPSFLGVVTVQEKLAEEYVNRGIPADKVLSLPDAVDLSEFAITQTRDDLRQEIGLPADKHVAMHCGHLYEERGVDALVQVATMVPDVHFVFVGGWPEDIARCQSLVREMNVSNVEFKGFVHHRVVPKFLIASDVLLMPYRRGNLTAERGSPLKLFEYMAARRPIISADVPAARLHLEHEQNALLVDPESVAAWAGSIQRLIQDSALAERIATLAYESVRNFTWDKRAAQIIQRFSLGV